MDVYAELSARQQRPLHPTMAGTATTTTLTPTISSPKMKFPVAPTTVAAAPYNTSVAVPDPATTDIQKSAHQVDPSSSPSSPQRIQSAISTGSSPTKTNSSSSSYEFQPTFTQFHPSNKPTAPLYRPAALRSADHPAPPQPFPRRNSFTFTQVPIVKKDHWKVPLFHGQPLLTV